MSIQQFWLMREINFRIIIIKVAILTKLAERPG